MDKFRLSFEETMKKIIIFFLILFFSGVSGTPLGAQDIQNVKNLFLELGDPKTTNAAAERILSLSAKDPAARNYAVDKLPEMIEKTTFDQVWRNAVRLAGKLKAASTAPSLM